MSAGMLRSRPLSKADSDKEGTLFRAPPPNLLQHPLFSPSATSGLITAESPKFPTDGINSEDLEKHLTERGLKFERTYGDYGGRENSYIVHNPTRETMFDMGRRAGQEAICYGEGGHHELLYTAGPNAGKRHRSLPLIRVSPHEPEGGYFTHIPNVGNIQLHFDHDRMEDAGVKQTMPASVGPAASPQHPIDALKSEIRRSLLESLRKALADVAPKPHPHAYPYHEGHSSYHKRSIGHGVLLTTQEFADLMPPLAKASPARQPPTDTTEPERYPAVTPPYGTLSNQDSALVHYPLHGVGAEVDKLLNDHGFTSSYAGGKFGRADRQANNYDTKHLAIHDPSAGSGGDDDHRDYVESWRKLHELAHALTLPEINAKYGEGRRVGGLGKRSLREAKRSVEWEHRALQKQRQLTAGLGISIPEDAYNRECNTVMHDAVHRSLTGKMVEPSSEGFVPHSHAVPLSVAHSMLDEHANHLGLQGPHDISKALDELIGAISTITGK